MRVQLNSARIAIVAATLAMTVASAGAQDFFSLFGGFDAPAPHGRMRMPFADDRGYEYTPRADRVPRARGSSQAFCVRTCDGRFFPIEASDSAGRLASCKSQCPSADTKIFYGGTIDNASSDNGKSYADMPNAFRFRNELVAGCTCNGKDQIGLAPVKIEDDPTLRKGDIVAGADGLMISRPSDRRGASLRSKPASREISDRYERPIVSADD